MKFEKYINESLKEKDLMKKVYDVFGLPDGLKVIDSQIIKDNRYDWWVILTYQPHLKKYYGLTSDDEMWENKNKSLSVKWFKKHKEDNQI